MRPASKPVVCEPEKCTLMGKKSYFRFPTYSKVALSKDLHSLNEFEYDGMLQKVLRTSNSSSLRTPLKYFNLSCRLI